jgi:hypothetical protein
MLATGEKIVAAVFAFWGLACVLIYLPRVAPILRYWDRLYLLPEWRFFAPMPGQGDFHLLYRDWFKGGQTTEWTEVTPMRPRPWWSAIWNPRKRANKALLDIVTELARESRSVEDKRLAMTTSYLSLLNFVSSLERSVSPEFVQFLLMHTHGGPDQRKPEMIFTSSCHRLC